MVEHPENFKMETPKEEFLAVELRAAECRPPVLLKPPPLLS